MVQHHVIQNHVLKLFQLFSKTYNISKHETFEALTFLFPVHNGQSHESKTYIDDSWSVQ